LRGANTPMRRMLSGFLAASMVASVCATASFALKAEDQSTSTEFRFDFSDYVTSANDVTNATIEFYLQDGGSIILTAAPIEAGANGQAIADAFIDGEIDVDGKAMFEESGRDIRPEDLKISRSGSTLILSTKIVGQDAKIRYNAGNTATLTVPALTNVTQGQFEKAGAAGAAVTNVPIAYTNAVDGKGSDGDITLEGIGKSIDIRDIVVCDEDGEPIPLTESSNGVDKDQNGDDGVQSGQTVYFMIRNDTQFKFHDDTYWKMKLSKGDNGKYIKEISDTTKNFGNDLYNIYTHTRQIGSGNGRARYIKVKMSELYTDDEIKLTLDLRLTPKSKAQDVYNIDDDAEVKVQDFIFYMKNLVKNADGDWKVGIGGLMLNPVKNDWNDVTYYDEDGDVAFMKFFGDSDTGKFYAKLSTKWEHADYASYFNDQDAYIFQFTGSPNLSSTSRADLQIYSPFVDDDGNETFDPEQAVIYQVVDGDLFDITDSFTYEEGDNGDMAFCTRTRFLGTYIICQKPVDEASNDDVVDLVPDDLVPDDNTNAPVDVTPGNNGGSGSKAPANTGKF